MICCFLSEINGGSWNDEKIEEVIVVDVAVNMIDGNGGHFVTIPVLSEKCSPVMFAQPSRKHHVVDSPCVVEFLLMRGGTLR